MLLFLFLDSMQIKLVDPVRAHTHPFSANLPPAAATGFRRQDKGDAM